MKAISFLGFNENGYKETTYLNVTATKKCKTNLFQEALVEFYHPEVLYVLLTKKAETGIPKGESISTWETLQKRLEGRVKLQPIFNVPEGHTQDDIWHLFNLLTDCLQEKDQVLFDITYGFRSLSVVSLIAVSFLRVVRQVKIEGLIYGSFIPGQKENPTFDLLPIVSLLEWTTATDQFLKTGNGQELASLLRQSDEEANQNLANSIDGIARGLQLLRPVDVMTEAAGLRKNIEMADPNIYQSVPPFVTLLKQIEQNYGNFALANPRNYTAHAKESLLQQLKMIEWYAAKGQFVQALSLAREWLPSLLCYHFNLDPWVDWPNRDEMELLLTGGKNKKSNRESQYLEEWNKIPESQRKQLTQLWGDPFKLANLRNDVLHAGFRKSPRDAKQIEQEVEQIIQKLQAIKKDWKLEG
ncbi:MAG: TIGR02221 family CRISPR-associated protein [Planktothrix sp.]